MSHICFITAAFNREDPLIVFRQGASLVTEGHSVTYLLCDGKLDEVKYGIKMVAAGNFRNASLYQRFFVIPRIFRKYLKKFHADVYQISDPELLPLGAFLKKKGYKVVFNLREYYPDYYARKFSSAFLQKVTTCVVRSIFKHYSKKYDAVFSCMPEMSNIIEELPCKYFANVANFPIVNKDFSLTYDEYLKRDNIISYFGSIYNISCQEEFLQAISPLTGVKYLLAGVFYSEAYKQKVISQKGWNKVIFKNGFTRSELPCIINSSIIGNVMKDFNETETPQGSYSIIKIFETMEAAVPVLLAKVPLYEEMVKRYNCGICVDPHDVEGIRNAIIYLLENKELAYEMGQNGRRAVIEEFSWDTQFKNYYGVIKKILNE